MRNTVDRAPAHDRTVGAIRATAIPDAHRGLAHMLRSARRENAIAWVVHWDRSAALLHVADRRVGHSVRSQCAKLWLAIFA
jgi:hypothetical protein